MPYLARNKKEREAKEHRLLMCKTSTDKSCSPDGRNDTVKEQISQPKGHRAT